MLGPFINPSLLVSRNKALRQHTVQYVFAESMRPSLLVCVLALLVVSLQSSCCNIFGQETPATEVCTDENCTIEGCHHLDSSITLDPEHVRVLLASLTKLDPVLTSEIRKQIITSTYAVHQVLDRYCLLEVSINPESRVKVDPGRAPLTLEQGKWNIFLVKVKNLAGVTAPLKAESPHSIPIKSEPDQTDNRAQWLEMQMVDLAPLPPKLTGQPLDYRIIKLRTTAQGKRTAKIAMDVGQGTADIGFRNDVMLTFRCERSRTTERQAVKVSPVNFKKTAGNSTTKDIDLSKANLQGIIVDANSGHPLPARIHIQSEDGTWYLANSLDGKEVHYVRDRPQMPGSPEVHTTLSPGPFASILPPGKYTIRVERGKEYLPIIRQVVIRDEPVELEFELRRWINMAERGWYSGDTHVHRTIEDLPNVILAEDLNVALPLSYWVTKSAELPASGNGSAAVIPKRMIEVDQTHVIHPLNTEYEIFSVGARNHTLGAVFVLNHKTPLPVGVPPVGPVAKLARKQGALLDLDKHSWPWSMMIVPVMDVDLFELSNNHVWQTKFAFKEWTLSTAPPNMDIERDQDGFTEQGWIDFGFQTYYTLVNCGFRLRVSAGTASGVHPVQLGFGRVYVHLPEGFNYEDWMAGLDAGKSFVSTGPMLDVRFNDQSAGYTFKHVEGDRAEIRVVGTAESKRPLDRIEIVVNGRVHKTIVPSNKLQSAGGYRSEIDEVVLDNQSYWLAVRCFEKHPEGRIRFAHTNPVYTDIAGRPLRPRKSEVAYLVQRMEEELESNREVLSDTALEEYRHALTIYQKIAETAR